MRANAILVAAGIFLSRLAGLIRQRVLAHYFGQKDVQQTVVIKRMVQDFHVGTDVRIVETAREADGLAMSSRNVYLGEQSA